MKEAAVDRIEGQWAVLMFEDQSTSVNVPLAKLPDQIREGDYLRVTLEDGEVVAGEIDQEAKARAQARIQAKLDRLRRGDHLKD